jgi:hypothetical protein
MKIGEPTIVATLGNFEDEWTFSTLSFMKNRLRNQLSTQHPKVVNIQKLSNSTGLMTFLYDVDYDD